MALRCDLEQNVCIIVMIVISLVDKINTCTKQMCYSSCSSLLLNGCEKQMSPKPLELCYEFQSLTIKTLNNHFIFNMMKAYKIAEAIISCLSQQTMRIAASLDLHLWYAITFVHSKK